jgi:hypothetical protein
MPDEIFSWNAVAEVHKYFESTVQEMIAHVGREPLGHEIEDLVRRGLFAPDEIHREEGNLLTTAGLNRITSLFEGAGGTVFNHADAFIGVGSSSTLAAIGDTGMGGDGSTTTAYYQPADTGYPTQSGGVINCNATFQTGNANFAWNEWGMGDASGTLTAGGAIASVGTSPILINHKIASLGTKASGAIWTLQATATIA